MQSRAAIVLVLSMLGARVAGAQSVLTLRSPDPAPFFVAGPVAVLGDDILVARRNGGTGVVHLHDGSTGAVIRTFSGPTLETIREFGRSLAVLGGNVLVGDPSADDAASDAGAVYLFDGATGALLQTFLNPGSFPTDFGGAVAVVGGNVLVGARFDSTQAHLAGAAYLFDAGTGALLQAFFSPAPQEFDGFGTSVAAVGGNILVGAPQGDDPGVAYLFAPDGTLLRTFDNPAPAPFGHFGEVVGELGGRVVVRGQTDPDDHFVVYIFDAATGALLHSLPSPELEARDRFGASIATLGTNLLIGAPADSLGVGTAYVIDPDTETVIRTIRNATPGLANGFGISVATLGANPVVASADGDQQVQAVAHVYCGGATGCGPCETCGVGGTCVLALNPSCRTPGPRKAIIRLASSASDTRDRITFKFRGSGVVGLEDFGLPQAVGRDTTLCVFDASNALVFRATAPGGGWCGTGPCWHAQPATLSYKYKNPERTPDGLKTIRMRAAPNVSSETIILQGAGANLSNSVAVPTPPLVLPLTVQLQGRDSGCFEGVFSAATVNAGGRLSATSD